MSSKLNYYRAINTITTHSLLHLLFIIKGQKRFVPVKHRNEILVKRLKPRLSLKGYAPIKKELKDLIHIGRKSGADLESKLWELADLSKEMLATFTDADLLYILFTNLAEKYDYGSCLLSDNEPEFEENTIYMSEKDIEFGFDDNNKQVCPVQLWVKSSEPEQILEYLRECSEHHHAHVISSTDGILQLSLSISDTHGNNI